MENNINVSTRQIISDEPEKKEQLQPISFRAMFRFATSYDYILMAVGTVCACAMGTALPAFALLWGSMTNSFGNNDTMVEAAKQVMLQFIYIGLGALVAGWGMFGCWMITGDRQGIACRKQYLKSLLKQQIGWFDTINQSELATKFATDSFAFQGAIGEKVSTIIMTLAMFVAGFIIAFYTGWLMTLVSLCSLPLIALGGYLYATAIANKDKAQQKQYAQAGGMSEQAIAAIKTVKQLNGEQFQADNYSETLKSVTKRSFKYGIYLGIGMGALFLSMLWSYALGFWFGSHCVEGTSSCPPGWNGGHVYTAGGVLVVFFSILMAGFNLSQLTPSIKKIAEGMSAGRRIFSVIDREPTIKSIPNAIKPKQFRGVFKFEEVTFAYPKDKSNNILSNLSLTIDSKSVGFVGESGCGKSTIFQLMMRFYDPDNGRITLDDVDLRDLDLFWLRDQIGYVGQEPVLFATSLKENMLFGKEDATEEEINEALKKAEAYDFVYNLTDKLQTYVGTGGGQISGGQKQRIAIARAILKNPKVLLLDEATSALDRRNQKLIQNTLNKIAEEKITITIAHRVKTIMNCSQIYVLDRGAILEHGKFHQLKKYKDNKEFDENEETVLVKAKSNKQVALEQIIPDKVEQQEAKAEPAPKDAVAETAAPLTKEEKQKKQQEELVKKYENDIFTRLFSYCSHRKLLFAFGIFVCMVNGLIFPAFSIFLSKMLAILIDFEKNPSGARQDANTYALIFFLLGILSFIVQLLQQTIFSMIGEEMTEKIRKQTYLKILKMPVVWFDKPRNSSGSLSARLASDCQTVNGLTTTYMAIMAQNLTNLTAGIIIAFIFEWRTSLVALGLIPLMIISGAIQMSFMSGFSDKTDAAYKDSSNLITEAMINIRTVTSFGYEDMIERKYSQRLKQPLSIGIKKGNISGILYGLSQFIMFVVFALIFFFGTMFIRDNGLSIADVFTAIYAIMFAGMTAGNNSHFLPDVAAGKKSAANIFQILDGEDEDQLQIKEESKMLKTQIKGHLQLKGVDFKYESRDEHVFTDMNLDIHAGWKVGFVGPSGCGKSTIHQLLQRFYEPTKGEILLDGINLKDYDIHFLRSSLGVVSQQPVLFNETIGHNIKYNKHDATHAEIVEAANESNFNPEVHKIEQVEAVVQTKGKAQKATEKEKKENENVKKKDGSGFEKNVGVKGSHISGGQKQRVAIARVILRHPTVLLLDEATSALDSVNEKVVQDSLDRIMTHKTTINIAHRIDTVRNSNQIFVFEKGKIIEKGTYNQLMQIKGYFYKLERGLQFV